MGKTPGKLPATPRDCSREDPGPAAVAVRIPQLPVMHREPNNDAGSDDEENDYSGAHRQINLGRAAMEVDFRHPGAFFIDRHKSKWVSPIQPRPRRYRNPAKCPPRYRHLSTARLVKAPPQIA
jgi:hypothetical protein